MKRLALIVCLLLLLMGCESQFDFAETKTLAEQGQAEAQFYLGVMYNNGEGVPQDQAEAVKWFRKAADQGHAPAQNNLGSMHRKGEGIPQNDAEAAKWYRKAADQGFAEAQHNLAIMYNYGRGVPQNDAEAYVWSSLAVKSGIDDAVTNRDISAKKLTPADKNAAQKRAAKLFEEIQQRRK
jgi:TPR repeat protein